MDTKLNEDKVLKFINSTVRGKTATQTAKRFNVAKTTASRFLTGLVGNFQATVTGTTQTGQRGRPGRLFKGTNTATSNYV